MPKRARRTNRSRRAKRSRRESLENSEMPPSNYVSPEEATVIHEMLKMKKIPKDYTDFEKFIKKIMSCWDWTPPLYIIFSVWKKLQITEEKVIGYKPPPPIIDLSDKEIDNTIPDVIQIDCREEIIHLSVSCDVYDIIPVECHHCAIFSISESNSEAPETVQSPIAWYLPPVSVNDPTTSAKSTDKLETNAHKTSQQGEREEESIFEVKPLQVVPDTEPGASATQSSTHQSVNPIEEQAMELRQIMLIDKVIERELPKILQDQTGGTIPQSVICEHVQKVLQSSREI